jgi:hypothetical protein
MFRFALLLAAALAASSAHAATIFSTSPPNQWASIEDPGPGWVHFLVGGNLDVTTPALAIITSAYLHDQVWVDQLAGDARHSFYLWSGMLSELHFRSPDRPNSVEHHLEGANPADYANVETWEMIGGDIIDVGGGVLHHEWTYVVDGGAPESVSVPITFNVPEPSALALACVSLLCRKRRHVL